MRLRPQRRRTIEWGAAALAAAALYLTPALLIAVLSGIDWAIAAFAVCLAALVLYSLRFGSPLGVLLTLVIVACVELAVRFATAAAQTCGSSRGATGLEWAGAALLLLGLGSFGTRHRRVAPVIGGVVAAGIWIAVVAHVVPGGAGECFN